jgi:hypothetical protein
MRKVRELLWIVGLTAILLAPAAAQAQQFNMRGKICPWGMQIIQQQQQQQMMWQYRQQQQQTQLTMQMRQRQQYQQIQKSMPGPKQTVSRPPYVRNNPPQVTKQQFSQPLVRRQVTQQMVSRQVAQPISRVQNHSKMVAVHRSWIHWPEGPGPFFTLSRAELLALLRLEWQSRKMTTAVHTLHQAKTNQKVQVTAVPRHRNEVKHMPPVVHQPHQVKQAAPPQHQHITKAKTVAELQVALKVQKKTTADAGMIKITQNITMLDIRCARCHQRMQGQPNLPAAIPQAHPPLHKPLVKAPPPQNPLAKGPVPFKNPLVKNPGTPFKNLFAKNPVPFKQALAKSPVPFKNPLVKEPVPFKQALVKEPVRLRTPLVVQEPRVAMLFPKESPLVLKQPPPVPQPKPLPMALAKLPPPPLALAFPAPKTLPQWQQPMPTPVTAVKPIYLPQPWRSGPTAAMPIGPVIPGPFATNTPGFLLPALVSAGQPPSSRQWTSSQDQSGTTPVAGMPDDSPIDLATGLPKQEREKSSITEEPYSHPSGKDLLHPEFPPLPPSVLLLRPRLIPRNQDAGPNYSPLRWLAEQSRPMNPGF